ncbi:MAG: hypothetical protein R2880_12035 [Deinococcales bacterium]
MWAADQQIQAKATFRQEQGVAIVAALGFMVITIAIIATAMLVSMSNKKLASQNTQVTQAQFIAESGIDQTLLQLWHGASQEAAVLKQARNDFSKLNLQDLREVWGMRDEPLLAATDGSGNAILDFGEAIEIAGTVSLANNATANYTVSVRRQDVGDDTTILQIISTGQLPSGAKRRLQQNFEVSYPPFSLEFALLTDSINCTFCHSAFTSIEAGYSQAYGNPSNNYLVDITNKNNRERAAEGTQRIRVGGLSDMVISTGYSRLNTLIGGTVYTRGSQNIVHSGSCSGSRFGNKCSVYGAIYQANGAAQSPLVARTQWLDFTLSSTNPSRNLLMTCTPSLTDGNAGCETRNARFYANYPLEIAGKPLPIDGNVPEVQQFPSPITDKDGDRLIDDGEWEEVVSKRNQGRLLGAQVMLLSETDATGQPLYNGSETFTVGGYTVDGLSSSITISNTRGIKGNLILIGTSSNPIRIDGTIYVDGDVIIQGYVAPGNYGIIMARHNIYIAGDVVYDCNGTASGSNCTYYEPNSLPRLALIAGGVMLFGDPARNANNNPLQGELAAFNDRQWKKLQNSQIDTARYYVFREGDQIPWRCTAVECRDFIDSSGGGTTRTLNDTLNPTNVAGSLNDKKSDGSRKTVGVDRASMNNAVLMSISPSQNWLTPQSQKNDTALQVVGDVRSEKRAITSEKVLQAFWNVYGNTNGRSSSNKRPIQIDGFLYTNNAVLGYFPAADNHFGSLILNGSMIAYETGLLIYGHGRVNTAVCQFNQSRNLFEVSTPECVGLRVQYDRRLPSLLDIREETPVLQRASSVWIDVE